MTASVSRGQSFAEIKLGDAVTFQRGFDITKNEQTEGNVPIVSSSGVSSFHNQWKTKGPGVVIGRKGTLGTVHYLQCDFWPHDTTLWVKDFKGNDRRLIYYFLQTLHLENFDTGASNPTLNRNHLHKIKVVFPCQGIQKKIAAVLSAYDDLIENNRRRIALLEKMAEEIYREWFVRMRFPGHEQAKFEKGVPVGWSQVQLGDIADINTHSIKRGREPEWIEYLDISAVSTNQMTAPSKIKFSEAPGRARRLVEHGDVIWSSVRPGNRAYCLVLNPPDSLVASTGFAVITPKSAIPYSFVHQVVTTDGFVEEMVSVAKGAAYPATSFEDFERAKVLLPNTPLLKRFHENCEPLLLQADRFRKQIPLLSDLRDVLLPRLISGKLAVDNLDIRFPPSMTEPGNGVPEAA